MRPMQKRRSHARTGIATIQVNSAIKRFPDSPGDAVKADIENAATKITIAVSAAMATSCLQCFLINNNLTFLF